MITFQSSCSSSWVTSRNHANFICPRFTTAMRTNPKTVMIQRPDRDGPPDLEAFFDKKRKASAPVGAPVTLGTGRANLQAYDNDQEQTCLAAWTAAINSLPSSQAQLVYCTFSSDFDPLIVSEVLKENAKVPVLGRTVNKKESVGTIEVLILASEESSGISVASATTAITEDVEQASRISALNAANKALDGLESRESCTFMMFCHTPGSEKSVRAGLEEALAGIVAYGGPAIGNDISNDGWAVFGDGSVRTEAVSADATVHVAAVPGSLSFLYSAVIKSWAQPAYTEPLSYMKPSYVDDPQIDLLTAIRYSDWEKFIWCIENQGVDVNTTWKDKQNQSPLLAACARARTEMVKYLLDHGANVAHRNDGGFTASMYTRMLSEYDRPIILNQLKMLEEAGANTALTEEERGMIFRAANGRIVE